MLTTALTPSWGEIGKLGVIAVIRTALNYVLSREMSEYAEKMEHEERRVLSKVALSATEDPV